MIQRNEEEATENFFFPGIRKFVKSKTINWVTEVAKTVNMAN